MGKPSVKLTSCPSQSGKQLKLNLRDEDKNSHNPSFDEAFERLWQGITADKEEACRPELEPVQMKGLTDAEWNDLLGLLFNAVIGRFAHRHLSFN